MTPRAAAAATARADRAATWLVKALVEATPISGPAWVGNRMSASRAMVLVWTLTTAAVDRPCSRHQRRAARVSAVSPDWEITMQSVPLCTGGAR